MTFANRLVAIECGFQAELDRIENRIDGGIKDYMDSRFEQLEFNIESIDRFETRRVESIDAMLNQHKKRMDEIFLFAKRLENTLKNFEDGLNNLEDRLQKLECMVGSKESDGMTDSVTIDQSDRNS